MQPTPKYLNTQLVQTIALPFLHQSSYSVQAGPLMLWLHGAGRKGANPAALQDEPVLAAARHFMPFMHVLCPVCPGQQSGWDIPALLALLDHAIESGWADHKQIIIAGISMGGRGAWELAYDHAHRLCAVIACAAVGLPTLMPRLGQLPCWIAHGDQDPIVPVTWARAVAAARPSASYHELTGAGHDIAHQVTADPALWAWIANTVKPDDQRVA